MAHSAPLSAPPEGRATGHRYGGIDAARLTLACMVVLAHCAAFQALSPEAHFLFNNGIARIIVPFFLLTTGYFFDRQEQRGIAVVIWRVVRVYLGWTFIFLPFILMYQPHTPSRLALTVAFGYFHLWYLPALIGGLILLHAARNLPDGVLMALSAGLFCVGGVIQYAENLWFDFASVPNHYDYLVLTRNFLFYGFPFLALGLLIARGRILASESLGRRTLILVIALGLLTAETILEMRAFDPEGFFDLTFSTFLLTPVLFVFVRDLPVRMPGFDPRHLSMVIYLSHPLYLLPLRIHTDLGPVALTVATFAATLALAPAWMKVGQRLRILP